MALVNRVITNSLVGRDSAGAGASRGSAGELAHGIVVVPTLLTTRAALEEQIERLEVHYLASQDGDLRFALLSDWTDSASESAPDDEELLTAAAEGIARLNRRYGPAAGRRPFLPSSSPAGLERGAGKVDRMGTQAWKTARAESIASRCDRHDLRRD